VFASRITKGKSTSVRRSCAKSSREEGRVFPEGAAHAATAEFTRTPVYPARQAPPLARLASADSQLPGAGHQLLLGRSQDASEHEADKVASRVMRMTLSEPTERPAVESAQERPIARRKASGGSVQGGAVPGIVHQVLRSAGQPLDAGTRSFFEPRFGLDFSQVRVHTDSLAAQSARRRCARLRGEQ
jgi:Domain of unknown function (DUF4157)